MLVHGDSSWFRCLVDSHIVRRNVFILFFHFYGRISTLFLEKHSRNIKVHRVSSRLQRKVIVNILTIARKFMCDPIRLPLGGASVCIMSFDFTKKSSVDEKSISTAPHSPICMRVGHETTFPLAVTINQGQQAEGREKSPRCGYF